MSIPLRLPPDPITVALAKVRGARLASAAARPVRRRGRPPAASPEEVQAEIRRVAASEQLFRVHIARPALYARARRLWGSWAGALLAAGIDYEVAMAESRRRSSAARERRPGTHLHR